MWIDMHVCHVGLPVLAVIPEMPLTDKLHFPTWKLVPAGNGYNTPASTFCLCKPRGFRGSLLSCLSSSLTPSTSGRVKGFIAKYLPRFLFSCNKMMRVGLMSWINRKIVDPLMQILRKGLEPKLLAFSGALGMTLGLFPVCGVTVLLCGMAIALLGERCHAPTVILTNFVATPIELSLVVPFLRFGEAISGGEHFPLNSDAMKKVVTGQASREVLLSIFHALLGWLVAAPLILGAFYVVFLPCFKHLIFKFSPHPLSPRKPLVHSEVKLKVRDV